MLHGSDAHSLLWSRCCKSEWPGYGNLGWGLNHWKWYEEKMIDSGNGERSNWNWSWTKWSSGNWTTCRGSVAISVGSTVWMPWFVFDAKSGLH